MTLPPSGLRARLTTPAATRIEFLGIFSLILAFLNSPAFHRLVASLWDEQTADNARELVRLSTPGIVIALVVTFYIEVIRRGIDDAENRRLRIQDNERTDDFLDTVDARIAQIEESIRVEPLDRSTPEELARRAVARGLTIDAPDVGPFVTLVLGRPGAPIIRDCHHEFVLSDEPSDPNAYALVHKQHFRADLTEYVLAVTADANLHETIAFDCPDIFDAWFVPSVANLSEYAAQMVGDSKIFHFEAIGDFSSRVPHALAPIPKKDYQRYLGRHYQSDTFTKIALLRAELPGPSAYSVEHRMIRKGENYVFWQADRPTFVERMSFNVSGFRPHIPETEFTLLPCCGCTNNISRDGKSRTLSIELNSWLVRGQGAVLLWKQ